MSAADARGRGADREAAGGGTPGRAVPAPIRFTVNQGAVTVAGPGWRRLADALRDDLGLTGTKLGCHSGDCGACTVLIDGAQACACLVPVGQCDGREVRTVEGLARSGFQGLQQRFAEHGAAQCGICTPGMLMAAADLLARHPRPSEQQVLDGLGGVLCRCTGYRKIVEAVLAAAGDAAPVAGLAAPRAGEAVGARLPRRDAPAKLTGQARYGADEAPADALWLKVVRAPHAHARFQTGDLDAFVRDRGLHGVLTAADIPNNRFAIFPDLRDQPAIAYGHVRFLGEAVLVLVGQRDRVEAIDPGSVPIHYEPLVAAREIDEALAPGAPVLHERWPDNVLCRGRVVRGDVDRALAQADPARVFEATMRTPYVEHAYLEPEAGWARVAPASGQAPLRVVVFACTQTPYMDRDELAHLFGLAPAQVSIRPSEVGGGFGGKLDLSVQPFLVAAALKFGRPVRIVYDRTESMRSTTKRHPSRLKARLALDARGDLLAYDFHGDFNTGAYASWGPTVANRVPIHASGPYRVPNLRALTRAVHTHNAISGAFRGFGVPQATLLGETLIDLAAQALGEDPLEYRLRQALRAGDATATGQVLSASVGLQACLRALRPAWRAARDEVAAFNAARSATVSARGPDGPRRGVGIACMWYGIGNTVIANPSTMSIGLTPAGRFVLHNGAVDIGQGSFTVMLQIAADALGVPVDAIDQIGPDTDLTADAGKSSASRQTFVSGNAARLAGEALRGRLLALLGAPADANLSVASGELVAAQGAKRWRQPLGGLAVDAMGYVAQGEGHFDPPTVPLDADGQGVPYATYGFAAQFAVVEVDQGLGTTTVVSIHAAHDVGRAVNPTQVEGQVHGGIAQGLGLALMEEYLPGRTDNLHDYLIPTAGDVPPITVHLVEDPEPLGPFGAKGVGEPALVATAPAILNAIHDAVGVRLDQVPVTPDRLRAAILARGSPAGAP